MIFKMKIGRHQLHPFDAHAENMKRWESVKKNVWAIVEWTIFSEEEGKLALIFEKIRDTRT